jgi:hypothetical protein
MAVPSINTFGMLDELGNNFLAAQQRDQQNDLLAQATGAPPPSQQPGFFGRLLSGQNPFVPQTQNATGTALPTAPPPAASPTVASAAAGTGIASGMKPFQDAIASIESSGSGGYSAIGPKTASGDQAYGKYQVMGANIPQWTQEVLGQSLTPQQFLASPQAQDAVFNSKFGSFLKSTGSPQDAASMWFTGRTLAGGGAAARDVNNMSGQQYAAKFQRALDYGAGGGPSAGPTPVGGTQLAGQVPTPNTVSAGAISGGNLAIPVSGYEGQFTRGQADDSEGKPSQAEWDAANAARLRAVPQGVPANPAVQAGGRLDMTPAPGATGPSGVPSVGSGATATPAGQNLIFPYANTAMLAQMANGPYGVAAKMALEQRVKLGEPAIQEVPVNDAQGNYAGTQKAYVSIGANGQPQVIPFGAVDTTKVKESTKFSVIGEDQFGNKQYGFVDPTTGKVTPYQGGAGAAPAQNFDLHGEAYIATLDPRMASQVRAILEGRAPYPTGMLLKTPYGQQLAAAVTQADPTFESGNATARVKVRNEFLAGGPSSPAARVTAGNNAINHMDEANYYAQQLNDLGFDTLNAAANAATPGSSEIGKALKGYNTAVNNFAGEIVKFNTGSEGALEDRREKAALFSQNLTAGERKNAMLSQLGILTSNMSSLQERWREGMGPLVPDFNVIHPDSLHAIERIKGNEPYPPPGGLPPSLRGQFTQKGESAAGGPPAGAPIVVPGGAQGQSAPPAVGGTAVVGGTAGIFTAQPMEKQKAAIIMLRKDPSLAPDLDAKFGLGTSDRILGRGKALNPAEGPVL